MADFMKTNVVLVCKHKLGSADDVLPILMEIQQRYVNVGFMFLFPDDETYELNRKNYDLWKAIESLVPKVIVTRRKTRLGTLIVLMRLLLMLAFKRNVILKMTDIIPGHRKFMKVLKKVSDTIEVRCYLFRWPVEGVKNINLQWKVIRRGRGNPLVKDVYDGEYEYFMSSLPLHVFEEYFGVNPPVEKMIKVGYTHRMPQWRNFLIRAAGESSVVNSQPYCLYILQTLGKRIEVLNEPLLQEVFEETLTVLKKYSGEIRTVFKPHAASELNLLEESLRRTGFKNYTIDFGHAMVLASGAKFVISYVYSTTMIDAFYLGKPIVEYSAIDPELLSLYENRSVAGRCCDFFIYRDPRKLDDVLCRLMGNEISVDRSPKFIEDNFPETPPAFFEFWDRHLK